MQKGAKGVDRKGKKVVKEKYTLGKLIEATRKKQKITREALTKGIMSEGNFRKLESSQLAVDKFAWDVLLERLGVSSDIYECYITESELQFYELQIKIRNLANKCLQILYLNQVKVKKKQLEKIISNGRKYCRAYKDKLIEEKNREGLFENIHLVFLGIMEAYFLKAEGVDGEIRFQQIQETWKIIREETIDQLIESKQASISLTELEMVLVIADVYEHKQERALAKKILTWLLTYCLEKFSWEKTELVKLYPYTTWTLAILEGRDGNWERAMDICIQTMNILTEARSLKCMIPIMDFIITHWEKGNTQTLLYNKQQLKEQLDCLLEICKEYKQNPYGVYPLLSIEKTMLITEVIKIKREELNLTQLQLSSGIMEPETLSRFEQGKQNVRWKKIAQLLYELHMPTQKEQLLLDHTDANVINERKSISTAIGRNEIEMATRKLQLLIPKIDLESRKNKQYLLCTKTVIQRVNYQIESEESIRKQFEQALQLTISQYPDISIENQFLTKEEGVIINNIALSYKRSGKMQKSLQLFEQAIKSYEKQKIKKQYLDSSQVLLIENYVTLFDYIKEFNEAVKLSKQMILHMFQTGEMDSMDKMLYEIVWNLYESSSDIDTKKACKRIFLQALTIAKLQQNRRYIKFLLERQEKYTT